MIRFIKYLSIISLFLFLSCFLLVNQVWAAELPTPQVEAEVRASETEMLVVVSWQVDQTNQYGFILERVYQEQKETLGVLSPDEIGVETGANGGMFIDADVQQDEEYSYLVTTFDRSGEKSSPGEVTIKVTTQVSCVAEFNHFAAKEAEEKINISWDQVCGAVEYKLYRDNELIATTENNDFVDQNPGKGKHTYKIEAYNQLDQSSFLIKGVMAADPIASATTTVTYTGTAPATASGTGMKLTSPIPGDLESVIGRIINIAFGLVAIIALIYLVIGGFKYITSMASPEAQQGAKETMTSALIGLIAVLISYLVISFIIAQIGAGATISI